MVTKLEIKIGKMYKKWGKMDKRDLKKERKGRELDGNSSCETKISKSKEIQSMKRYVKVMSASMLAAALLLSGCGGGQKTAENPPAEPATEAPAEPATEAPAEGVEMAEQAMFTLEELAEFDGKDGRPAYVAVGGVVYDVTNADEWTNGEHKDGVMAGTDATEVIAKSPHGADVLAGLPVVGMLVE